MKLRIQVGSRRQNFVCVSIAIVGLILISGFFHSFAAEPEIALVYGEPWEDMRQRSSAKIAPAIPDEIWFRMPKSDARLRFIDPHYGFVTPLARFFAITFNKGEVRNIRMSPQVEPLLLDDALKVVLDLQDQWRANGWVAMRRLSAPPFADTPQWRALFRDKNKVGVTYWQAGGRYQVLLGLNRFKDTRNPGQERYMIMLDLGKPWLPEHIE
ncbi:hypothetical protein ACIGCH_18015 [Pseudomonas helleri]|uniref:Uncharacterized protein n=1 Tax=Pseudomonas helleri TaxID=1608996 RepID=A0A6A7YY75_9PSED|nr:hypothetical protein [Pseudomonas helleri]MQT81778.1 hypothetical protein [Pseudomonas helleri]MQU27878.1 hypothetical protein [Pseudomonas helleri]